MSGLDFPVWFGVGSYGGLACGLLAAAGVAGFALLRHRGTPRQLARSILVCLAASCVMLASVWWNQNRLDLYGPALAPREVLVALSATVFFGWVVPLGVLAGYLLLANASGPGMFATQWRSADNLALASLDDPARRVEPLGEGVLWGRLVPVDGEFAGQPLSLTRQLTLLGREYNNDIVIDDERTSRYHAELHWDHGHVEMLDRGSMNGTLVNRQVVRGRIPLKTGDVLDLGAQRYRLEILASGNGKRSAGDTQEQSEDTRKMPGAASAPASSDTRQVVPLVLSGGQRLGAAGRWELAQAVTTIGRDRERTICLPDESVSRLHAQIVRQRTGYFVSDLNSRNGTYLNGQPLAAPALLSPGDVLRVGEIELRCELAFSTVLGAVAPAPILSLDGTADSGHQDDPIPANAGHDEVPGDLPSIAVQPAERAAARLGPPRLMDAGLQSERESAS